MPDVSSPRGGDGGAVVLALECFAPRAQGPVGGGGGRRRNRRVAVVWCSPSRHFGRPAAPPRNDSRRNRLIGAVAVAVKRRLLSPPTAVDRGARPAAGAFLPGANGVGGYPARSDSESTSADGVGRCPTRRESPSTRDCARGLHNVVGGVVLKMRSGRDGTGQGGNAA